MIPNVIHQMWNESVKTVTLISRERMKVLKLLTGDTKGTMLYTTNECGKKVVTVESRI